MNRLQLIIAPGNRLDVARIIAEHLGPDVRVLHEPDGSPLLAGSPLHVSISHSRHYVAIALHPQWRIGVDIEEPRPEQLRRVISKFLAPEELPAWADRLLAAWTCKEAVFKAAATPALPFGRIDLTEPGVATVPDGRRFALQTTETDAYTLTIALPQLP